MGHDAQDQRSAQIVHDDCIFFSRRWTATCRRIRRGLILKEGREILTTVGPKRIQWG